MEELAMKYEGQSAHYRHLAKEFGTSSGKTIIIASTRAMSRCWTGRSRPHHQEAIRQGATGMTIARHIQGRG